MATWRPSREGSAHSAAVWRPPRGQRGRSRRRDASAGLDGVGHVAGKARGRRCRRRVRARGRPGRGSADAPRRCARSRRPARPGAAASRGRAGAGFAANHPRARRKEWTCLLNSPRRWRGCAAGGMPLPARERALFEPLLGVDLGSIRIHTGVAAMQTARALQCSRLRRRVRYRVRFRPVPAGNRQRAQAARPRARAYGSAAGYRARGSRGFVGAMPERHRGRHRRREGSTAQTMGPLDHHPRYPVALGLLRSRQWIRPKSGPVHRCPQNRETRETALRHQGRGLERGHSHISRRESGSRMARAGRSPPMSPRIWNATDLPVTRLRFVHPYDFVTLREYVEPESLQELRARIFGSATFQDFAQGGGELSPVVAKI